MTVGDSRYGFDIDLAQGVAREDAFAKVVMRSLVEHKRDWKAQSTHNIAVEYKQKGPPNFEERLSGIAITRAAWWAVEYASDCWLLLPVDRVKELANRAVREKRTKWGGDDNNYLFALIPAVWFLGSAGTPVQLGEPADGPCQACGSTSNEWTSLHRDGRVICDQCWWNGTYENTDARKAA